MSALLVFMFSKKKIENIVKENIMNVDDKGINHYSRMFSLGILH